MPSARGRSEASPVGELRLADPPRPTAARPGSASHDQPALDDALETRFPIRGVSASSARYRLGLGRFRVAVELGEPRSGLVESRVIDRAVHEQASQLAARAAHVLVMEGVEKQIATGIERSSPHVGGGLALARPLHLECVGGDHPLVSELAAQLPGSPRGKDSGRSDRLRDTTCAVMIAVRSSSRETARSRVPRAPRCSHRNAAASGGSPAPCPMTGEVLEGAKQRWRHGSAEHGVDGARARSRIGAERARADDRIGRL